MNSLLRLKNVTRCCPNCVCANKIKKNVLKIPLNPKEQSRFDKEYKDLKKIQLECDLFKTHLIKEFLNTFKTKDVK